MPQPSYLQQIAYRSNGSLPSLMPPRSPLMRTEAMSLGEMPEEQSSVLPIFNSLPTKSELLPLTPANSGENLPSLNQSVSINSQTELEPKQSIQVNSFAEENTTPKFTSTSSEGEIKTIQSVDVSPDLNQINQLSQKVKTDNFNAIKNTPQQEVLSFEHTPQNQADDLPIFSPSNLLTNEFDAQQELNENESNSQKLASLSSELNFSQPVLSDQVKQENTKAVLNQSRKVSAIEPTSRLDFVKSVSSDRFKTELQPKTTVTPSTPPLNLPPSNNIHIGSIDIQITPPPTAPKPPTVVHQVSKPEPKTGLSRGFASSFGLRQG